MAPILFFPPAALLKFDLLHLQDGSRTRVLPLYKMLQRPRITDIHVRMDCNGCVQKIKKAVNSVDGVYDIYIDLPQQKLTVIGRADPERIVKAIKKVRKTATICSHTEIPPDQNSQPHEPPADGGGDPPSSTETPLSEPPNPPPPEEPPKDEPPPQEPPPENQPPQNPPPETNPNPTPVTDNPNPNPNPPPSQPEKPSHGPPNDAEEVHSVVYHHGHPPDHGYRYGYGNGGYYEPLHHPGYQERRSQPVYYEPPPPPRHVYHEPIYHEPPPPRPTYPELLTRSNYHEPPPRPIYHEPPPPRSSYHEPPPPPRPIYHEPPPPRRASFQEPGPSPVYVTHSYNTSRPSPYITAYQYVESPPPRYTTYSRRMEMDNYSTDPYWDSGASASGNASSLFSDENPNACTIV